jgi:hypothetical protein
MYSQRQTHRVRDTSFLAFSKVSFAEDVRFREESAAHFVQHGAGRLTRSCS